MDVPEGKGLLSAGRREEENRGPAQRRWKQGSGGKQVYGNPRRPSRGRPRTEASFQLMQLVDVEFRAHYQLIDSW